MDASWVYIILTVLIAVIPEFGLFLWWGSGLSSRVKQLETDKDRLYKEVDGINTLSTRIAVLENKMDSNIELLQEIKNLVRNK